MYFEQNGYFSDETQEKDDATALKDFLLDIQCLDPLSEWTNTFNLFDILKLTRVEIRHSNMLAWLLNPNENHGFGDGVLRGFIQYIVSSFSYNDDIFDMLLMDCHSFIIQREWHNIDIIAFSPNENFLLFIVKPPIRCFYFTPYRRFTQFLGWSRWFFYSPDSKILFILI